MSRAKRMALTLALIALFSAALTLRRVLPTDRDQLIAGKYDGWSGVLQVWLCADWAPGEGGFAAWLNACAARFERRHPGVYAQCEVVDAGALGAWRAGNLPGPDALLFSPGLLDSSTGLLPLAADARCRPELRHSGEQAGVNCAMPVALGGYARIGAGEGDAASNPPEPGLRRDAALLALMVGERAVPGGETPDGADTGLDLGLPAAASAHAPRFAEGALKAFVDGEAPALLATQRDLRRLAALAGQGKGPAWALEAVSPFTDQLLFAAAADTDHAERQSLAAAFIAGLTDNESQQDLRLCGAFAVTDAPTGYRPGDALSGMDAALRATPLRVPRAFDPRWPSAADDILRPWCEGKTPAAEAWLALAQLLEGS